jgi:CNT family concentrative nucleoside transporter
LSILEQEETMGRFMGLLGIVAFMALAWAISKDRKAIQWRTILWALALQWIFAVIVLKGELISAKLGFIPWPTGTGWGVMALMVSPVMVKRFTAWQDRRVNMAVFAVVVLAILRGNLVGRAFGTMRAVVEKLMSFAKEGATFVFGPLADPAGAPVAGAAGGTLGHVGMVFAFVVLPTIIFVASVFAVLYYLGIMQWVVAAFARAINRFLKVSGAESLSVAASILMGQTEAPLTIRPFLARLTRSELMVVMTAGMAHVSGAIMVAYVQIANVEIVHLLTAVIMTAPGAIMMAKLMEPETGEPETSGLLKVELPNNDANVLDAAARGASEGLHLAFNVAGMLVAFIALVALLNGIMHGLHPSLSLERVLGVVFRPFAFLKGVPWHEAGLVGSLLGKRMVVNEFVAFIELGKQVLSPHAKLVSTFALCGFANFSSIAIQVGGIGALVPERRGDLARLGLKAMLAGTLANFLSACIAGVLG